MWNRFIKAEMKYTYTNHWSIVHLLLASLLNFYLYYYSAKAFKPSAHLNISDYFSYIVIGDLALTLIHTHMIDAPTLFVRLKQFGIFERLLMVEKNLYKLLLQVFMASFISKFLLTQLHVVILIFLFNLEISFQALLALIGLKLFVSFLFIGLYFLSVAIACKLKKVSNGMFYFMTLLSFFSGVYFPLDVFQVDLFKKWLSLSPIHTYIDLVRNFVSSQWNYSLLISSGIHLFSWGTLFFIFGIVFIKILNHKAEFIDEWN